MKIEWVRDPDPINDLHVLADGEEVAVIGETLLTAYLDPFEVRRNFIWQLLQKVTVREMTEARALEIYETATHDPDLPEEMRDREVVA